MTFSSFHALPKVNQFMGPMNFRRAFALCNSFHMVALQPHLSDRLSDRILHVIQFFLIVKVGVPLSGSFLYPKRRQSFCGSC